MKVAFRTHEPIKSESIMRAINLAYDNHVLQILPYAYYCVARMGGRRILKHKEGDIDWETKSKCLVGRDCLRLAVMNMSPSFLFIFVLPRGVGLRCARVQEALIRSGIFWRLKTLWTRLGSIPDGMSFMCVGSVWRIVSCGIRLVGIRCGISCLVSSGWRRGMS